MLTPLAGRVTGRLILDDGVPRPAVVGDLTVASARRQRQRKGDTWTSTEAAVKTYVPIGEIVAALRDIHCTTHPLDEPLSASQSAAERI